MSKIVIISTDPLSSSVMGYFETDGKGETKLISSEQPYEFSVAPGIHRIALNTQGPGRRSAPNGNGKAGPAIFPVQEILTGASWEGSIEFLEDDDVLLVRCGQNGGSGFGLKMIKESSVEDYLGELFADLIVQPRKISKLVWIIPLVIAGVTALAALAVFVPWGGIFEGIGSFFSNSETEPPAETEAPDTSDTGAESVETDPAVTADETGPAVPVTGPYYVNSEYGLNLRSGPSKEAAPVLEMPYRSVIEVIGMENGWAHVRYNGIEGYCSANYIAAGSPGDRFTAYGFTGSPSAELFQKLVRRCEEMWDYPINTLREMGLIDKDDMVAVYDSYEEGAERHIIGYAYAAMGIDTVYDVWDLYRIYFTENYLREHGLARYFDKADTGRRDGFLVQHGRYYFNDIIEARGGDLASVGSFRIEAEDCWRAEGTYLYSDNTFECTIVKENGRFKIDSFSVYEELY